MVGFGSNIFAEIGAKVFLGELGAMDWDLGWT